MTTGFAVAVLLMITASSFSSDNGGRRNKAEALPDDDDDDDDDVPLTIQASYSPRTRMTLDCIDQQAINFDLIILLLESLCFNNLDLVPFSSAILIFCPSLESIRRLTDLLDRHHLFGTDGFLILPLHSTISNENQSLVFDVPRAGVSAIVPILLLPTSTPWNCASSLLASPRLMPCRIIQLIASFNVSTCF